MLQLGLGLGTGNGYFRSFSCFYLTLSDKHLCLALHKIFLVGGRCPPDPPSRHAMHALIAYWNPPFQNSRFATGHHFGIDAHTFMLTNLCSITAKNTWLNDHKCMVTAVSGFFEQVGSMIKDFQITTIIH